MKYITDERVDDEDKSASVDFYYETYFFISNFYYPCRIFARLPAISSSICFSPSQIFTQLVKAFIKTWVAYQSYLFQFPYTIDLQKWPVYSNISLNIIYNNILSIIYIGILINLFIFPTQPFWLYYQAVFNLQYHFFNLVGSRYLQLNLTMHIFKAVPKLFYIFIPRYLKSITCW